MIPDIFFNWLTSKPAALLYFLVYLSSSLDNFRWLTNNTKLSRYNEKQFSRWPLWQPSTISRHATKSTFMTNGRCIHPKLWRSRRDRVVKTPWSMITSIPARRPHVGKLPVQSITKHWHRVTGEGTNEQNVAHKPLKGYCRKKSHNSWRLLTICIMPI